MSNQHADQPGPATGEFLAALEESYFAVKRMRRSVRMGDTLTDGLGLDSLDALEILVALEGRYGINLVDTDRVASVRTVADLYGVVSGVIAADPTGAP